MSIYYVYLISLCIETCANITKYHLWLFVLRYVYDMHIYSIFSIWLEEYLHKLLILHKFVICIFYIWYIHRLNYHCQEIYDVNFNYNVMTEWNSCFIKPLYIFTIIFVYKNNVFAFLYENIQVNISSFFYCHHHNHH